MFTCYRIKRCMSAEAVRAHACTLALSMGLASAWSAPRSAATLGPLGWALALAAAAAVAVPVAVLHLAVGQLGQDAVGMWRAVPFFQGIGYLRLLISFLAAAYNLVYVAVITTYLLRTIFDTTPFWACDQDISEMRVNGTDYYDAPNDNETSCLSDILTEPPAERPEFYLGLTLVIIAFWFALPFILYSPTKMMKRIYYALGPLVLIFAIVIFSSIGDGRQILSVQERDDWRYFLEPGIWHSALTHALWLSQISGGFLVSAGGTIYANMNVEWTALIFVGVNLVATWCGLLFWCAVGGRGDGSTFAVLIQISNLQEQGFGKAWSVLTAFTLLLSGIITMLALLYPLYDRFRRVGGQRWRMMSVGSSLCGVAASLALLAGGLTALDLIERVSVPFLISLTTVLEVSAFVFIYGRRTLVEDIAFLTEREPARYWVCWYAVLGVLTSLSAWWVAASVVADADWTDGPWVTVTFVATAALVLATVIVAASVTVAKQDQFDCIGKLRSSFKPSRHWGPRDPITHYYWMSSREEIDGNPRPRARRRRLGQLSGRPIGPQTPKHNLVFTIDLKRRNNSDDYVYTVYRKKCIRNAHRKFYEEKIRSKSVD